MQFFFIAGTIMFVIAQILYIAGKLMHSLDLDSVAWIAACGAGIMAFSAYLKASE